MGCVHPFVHFGIESCLKINNRFGKILKIVANFSIAEQSEESEINSVAIALIWSLHDTICWTLLFAVIRYLHNNTWHIPFPD